MFVNHCSQYLFFIYLQVESGLAKLICLFHQLEYHGMTLVQNHGYLQVPKTRN